jgi:hypothetical protein
VIAPEVNDHLARGNRQAFVQLLEAHVLDADFVRRRLVQQANVGRALHAEGRAVRRQEAQCALRRPCGCAGRHRHARPASPGEGGHGRRSGVLRQRQALIRVGGIGKKVRSLGAALRVDRFPGKSNENGKCGRPRDPDNMLHDSVLSLLPGSRCCGNGRVCRPAGGETLNVAKAHRNR